MTTVDLTSRPDMPMASAPVLLGGLQDRGDRLLDAEVDDLVAVVGQDDVDEVLADVVDVALDRGQHDGALALVVDLLHVRLEVGHRGLHHLGRLQHERQLHLAGAEQLADRPSCRRAASSLMISRARPLGQRLVEVGLQAVALAVDDAALQALVQRQRGQLLGPAGLRDSAVDALEQLQQLLQRVVALARGGRRSGRGRPRRCSSGIRASAGSWRRARSPSPARPRRTRAGTPS